MDLPKHRIFIRQRFFLSQGHPNKNYKSIPIQARVWQNWKIQVWYLDEKNRPQSLPTSHIPKGLCWIRFPYSTTSLRWSKSISRHRFIHEKRHGWWYISIGCALFYETPYLQHLRHSRPGLWILPQTSPTSKTKAPHKNPKQRTLWHKWHQINTYHSVNMYPVFQGPTWLAIRIVPY